MYSRLLSASIYGLGAQVTWIEVDIETGLPAFNIVGLVNQSVKESKDRIHAAIENCGYSFPQNRLTVNLTPANRRKEGSHYDIAIAVGVLTASKQLEYYDEYWDKTAMLGELRLDGKINPVEGVLPMVIGMKNEGIERVIIPRANLEEAELVKGMMLYPVNTLGEVIDHLSGRISINPVVAKGYTEPEDVRAQADFAEIRGQNIVKRAAMVAAAGMHGLLMVGPPGVGKSMIGRRIPGILPPLSYDEQLEITQVYSVAGLLGAERPMITERPFRAPHHSVTGVTLIGGGRSPHPGEVSLAHSGVLFLDELPEFDPKVLDMLRQPMEDRYITITRLGGKCTYPSNFMLVAAMNPCRCGYYGDPVRQCTCTDTERKRYVSHISGPLLDRIDLHITMERMQYNEIASESARREISSAQMRSQVAAACDIQNSRYRNLRIKNNGELTPTLIKKYCRLGKSSSRLMEDAFSRWNLSARSYHRILRLSRTIADLEGSENIKEEHVLEALSYRMPSDLLR